MAAFLQKVQHSNRVSLGPKELAPLADIIGAEKRLVDATQKLSVERTKASVALKEWGTSEGPDLGDILTKLSMLFDYVSNAEKAYAEHTSNARLHFKEIRTREEHLSSLKKSKETLGNKIENLDRKVSKMKEENKDLPANLQRLSEMRNEMVGLEHSVLNEESKLGDYKRATVREAMSLKLGALLELAEKTVVVAELGKLMVDEIPMDRTEPGAPRAHYNSYERTDELMQQAQRCIQDVVFNPVPLSDGQYDHNRHTSGEDARRAAHEAGYHTGAVDDHQGAYGAASSEGQWGAHQGYGTDHQGDPAYGFGSQPPALPEIYSAPPMLPPGAGVGEHFGGDRSVAGDHGALAPPVGNYASSNRSSLAYMGSNGSPYVDAPSEPVPRRSLEQQAAQQGRESFDQETPGQVREREQAEEAARAAQQPNPWRQDSQPPTTAPGSAEGHHAAAVAAAPPPAPTPAYAHGEEVPTQPRTPPIQTTDGFPSTPASAIGTGAFTASPIAPTASSFTHPDYERPYIPKPGDGAYHGLPAGVPPPPPGGSSAPSSYLPPVNAASGAPGLPAQGVTSPTQSGQTRKPVMIRGESALGSKYGDVFVPNRAPIDGGALNGGPPGSAPSPVGPPAGGAYGPASGYYRSSDAGSGKIQAGAFRRGPSNQYMSGSAVGGAMLPGPPRANEFGQSTGPGPVSPSESMSIRDQYLARDRDAASMQQPQQQSQPQQQPGSEGFAGIGAGPRFDVSPLNVPKSRSNVALGPGSAPSEVGSTAPPPSYQSGSNGPSSHQMGGAGSGSGTGFNASQFVTRLD